jgi:hypothetical protein
MVIINLGLPKIEQDFRFASIGRIKIVKSDGNPGELLAYIK